MTQEKIARINELAKKSKMCIRDSTNASIV